MVQDCHFLLVLDLSTLLTRKHFPEDLHIQNKSRLVEFVIERYLERHKPLCINNCTDSSHGICDIISEAPFQLGTCVCRPGWKGYDCSERENGEKSKFDY